MEYDSVLGQQSISGKNVSLIYLCVWKPCYVKSGHIYWLGLLIYCIITSNTYNSSYITKGLLSQEPGLLQARLQVAYANIPGIHYEKNTLRRCMPIAIEQLFY